ncbi:MAG TPA: tetratricopeptide repeat protein [Pyrinomonadaceae bacterium]
MDKNTVLYVIAALLLGFIGGFLLANAMNRSEISAMRSQTVQPVATATNTGPFSPSDSSDPSLSDDEIKAKLADADRDPKNFKYQKELGTALYKYASMKDQPELLPDVIRLLERADSLNNKDLDVIVALGDAYFDLGFQKKDTGEFQKARETYARALAIKPDNVDVETNNAITWFEQPSPDYQRAAAALDKVTAENPKHTRSMQFLVQTYIKLGRNADAQNVLDRIKAVDPTDGSIPELTKLLAAQGK